MMILFEDKEIIVCRKPAGIPVQSARIGQQDMESILRNYLAERADEEKQFPGKKLREEKSHSKKLHQEVPELHIVHRLDQPVEGVLVFAKTKRAAAALGKQVQDGTMKKTYHAVCHVGQEKDVFEQEPVTLVDYLVKDGKNNCSFVADKGRKDAKRAELTYRILQVWKEDGEGTLEYDAGRKYALVQIDLKTGRHHQIRVQMSHAGLPLYGDRKYNASASENVQNAKTQLALCASSLSFVHPVSGKNMRFEVKPQGEIFQIFKKLTDTWNK